MKTIYALTAGAILLLFSIQAFSQSDQKRFYKVAHRGAAKYAPENTLAAAQKAIDMGIDMIEMDIRQTKDGELVIMHDRKVSRTTNGKGKVHKMTLAQLKQLDAGAWFGAEYAGEKVPTLREMLQLLKGQALPDLDLKRGDVKLLLRLLEEEGFLDEAVTLHTFSKSYARQVKKQNDRILLRPSLNYGFKKYSPNSSVPVDVVNISFRGFNKKYIDAMHDCGKKVFVNLLGDKATEKNILRALEYGAEYIQVDNIELLMKVLQQQQHQALLLID